QSPRFKYYNYCQDAIVVISSQGPLRPGTFEHAAHCLIEQDGLRPGHPAQDHTVRLLLGRLNAAIAFDTSAESWLNQQSQYERWHAEQHRKELNVKKLVAA